MQAQQQNNTQSIQQITGPRQFHPLLPVLGPLAALIALTGMSRAVLTLSSQSSTAKLAANKMGASITPTTGTEKTIAAYVQAMHAAEQGNDEEALALLNRVEEQPLVVDRGTFQRKELANQSASVHLMNAVRVFTERAKIAGTKGDDETAERWLKACRGMGAQIARGEPNLDGLTLLRFCDEQTTRARLAVLEHRQDHGGALYQMLDQQRVAMTQFWRSSVLKEMETLGQWQTGAPPKDVVREERTMASRLMTRYLAEQARLHQNIASIDATTPSA